MSKTACTKLFLVTGPHLESLLPPQSGGAITALVVHLH